MQSLVIVIILLSLIGLYINLGSSVSMKRPEFKEKEKEKEYKNMSLDEIADKIIEESEVKPEFDTMGNSLKTGDGLEADKELVNLNVATGSVPNTKPHKWTTSTKRELDKNGLVKNTLSYKNNFPHDVNYLVNVQSKDLLRSSASTMVRNPKAVAFRSQIISPQDESKFREGFKFTDRAMAIVRNQAANQNKSLVDVRKINSKEITERASKNIYRIIPNQIEIKAAPDLMSVHAAHDYATSHSGIEKLNPANRDIDQMKSNYNFK